MLDFNHVLATPGLDLQYFVGNSNSTLIQWQTWRKPRGVKWIYLLGVGGGASGGTGVTGTTVAGGGSGGGSGAQTMVMISAFMIPDTLYIQCGAGGIGLATSAQLSVAGVPTYVCIEPSTTLTANMTLLFANGGAAGTAVANITPTGGTATTAAAAATIANMPLAGRGFYNFLAGQFGTSGGGAGLGTNQAIPTTGLMVTGGAGGGGSAATAFAGGAVTGVGLGTDFFPTLPGGTAAPGTSPAGAGSGGIITRNYQMNYGGTGGGGATTSAGGIAGAGGDGAPGCGGGGGAGATTNAPTLSKAGNGGPGFVLIASW